MIQASLQTYFKPKEPRLTPAPPTEIYDSASSVNELPICSVACSPAATMKVSERAESIAGDERGADVYTHFPAHNRPLNQRAQISRIDASHLSSIRRLTASTLPVRYPDKFFDETVTDVEAANLCRVAIYDNKPVGWIRCRLEHATRQLQDPSTSQIYIQALCILAPYRNCGLATQLLSAVLQAAVSTGHNPTFVYAHVWEDNEDALVWYENRAFTRLLLVEQYYRRLKPSGAWVVRRDLP
jgi:N-alpha-acetyltransferase 50